MTYEERQMHRSTANWMVGVFIACLLFIGLVILMSGAEYRGQPLFPHWAGWTLGGLASALAVFSAIVAAKETSKATY